MRSLKGYSYRITWQFLWRNHKAETGSQRVNLRLKLLQIDRCAVVDHRIGRLPALLSAGLSGNHQGGCCMLQATALHDPLYLGRLIAIYHDDAVQSFAPMGGFDQQGQFVQDEVFALALCRGRQGQACCKTMG